MVNELSPKQITLTKRQQKILEGIYRNERHEVIFKKLGIGQTTFYQDLKEIKDICGIIPETVIAQMALEQIRQLRIKLDLTFNDMKDSADEYHKFKSGPYIERPKDFTKLTLDEQAVILREQERRLKDLEDRYVRMQMQHSFALNDIIKFKKAIGIYVPLASDSDQSQERNITVIFSPGLQVPPPKEREANDRPK
jgi:hypothetical protein